MSGRAVSKGLAVGAVAAMSVAAWWFLAPPQLGGRTAYVTTVGTSMEPTLYPGDLVVVRPSGDYRVGEVVAYRNAELGAVVLHRIVARDGDRFVFKGDANDWLDGYRPSVDELLGEMVLRIPGLGTRLGAVRSPLGIGSVVGIAAVGALGGRRLVRRRAGTPEPVHIRERPQRTTPPSPGTRRGRPAFAGPAALAVPGALTVLAAAGAAVLLAIPATATVYRDAVYEHRGAFAYSATVRGGGPVYGDGRVGTGEPVYLKLVDRVEVTFRYELDTPAPGDVEGSVALAAVVSDVNGWSRTVHLGSPAPFQGPEAVARGVLDLAALRRMTSALERATGVDRLAYDLDVRATVELDGTLAGRRFAETFTAELPFLLDDLQLQVAPPEVTLADERPADPLNPVRGGLLRLSETGPRTFSLLGLELRIEPLRVASLAVAAVAFALLLGALLARLLAARRGEATLIRARYGRWLVPVRAAGVPATVRTVEVESFESLLRLAGHYGHPILYQASGDEHAYLVEELGVTYRYRTAGTR